ncbi:MAG TPA: RNA methyltransferase [Candidatus Dormibacteraeota bacterium]|nr:RNA methyltransferase [Candidatus Dormibacteraeota bacterium]
METLGHHSAELLALRELTTPDQRAERGLFCFEGITLLAEAHRSGTPIEAIYATQAAYEREALLAELARAGTPVKLIEERSVKRLSEVQSPSGIFAVAPLKLAEPTAILGGGGLALLLADLNDPGNAGTLLRAAEAFGASGVLLGDLGVDPYHSKLVRAAMGAHFRLPLARIAPKQLAGLLAEKGVATIGLSAAGAPIRDAPHDGPRLLAVGQERHGLGRWESLCTQLAAIPMPGASESLNAGVAGAIALYELTSREGAEARGRGGLSRE